jgi:hypothetical protein
VLIKTVQLIDGSVGSELVGQFLEEPFQLFWLSRRLSSLFVRHAKLARDSLHFPARMPDKIDNFWGKY